VPVVTYSILRLGLFVAALLGLWWAGMGGWLLVLVATVVAFVLSYVLLGRQRDAAALWLADRRAAAAGRPRFSARVEADAAAEDALADAAAHPARMPDAAAPEAPADAAAPDAEPDAAGHPDGAAEAPDAVAPAAAEAPDAAGAARASDGPASEDPDAAADDPSGQTARPSPSSTP